MEETMWNAPRPLGFPPSTQVPQQGPPVAAQTGHPPVGGEGGGGVGVGGGPPPSPGHDDHQHTFPPFPQPSGAFALEQLPPARDPSAQIVAGRGAFLVQMYLSTAATGGFVGAGEGGLDGKGVGGFVGTFVGFGVGGFVGSAVGGFVGAFVGGGLVGSAVGLGEGGFVGKGVGGFVGTFVGKDWLAPQLDWAKEDL
ncbi:hypothetical protein QTG54_016491 [Skeletonema marinoi]|uniref:Uncharacterized protein n=1 Tax=Skeletonema marinoi TaxID=267567 RepID=A0AAD9D4K7_9STRA|nr:hypothetical protein QTG54_016491 [Skeletonema marinoi]